MNHALLPSVAQAQLPARYEAARLALAECNKLDECKDWGDKAKALASYAKQAADKEMEKTAMRIRARAVRRCGELLKEVDKAQGGQPFQKQNSTRMSGHTSRTDAAKAAGLSKQQKDDALRVANVPAAEFESQVESEEPPTITTLADQGKEKNRAEKARPIYEKLGISKEAFQAGMYFRGDLRQFATDIRKHSVDLVVEGSTESDRAAMRDQIDRIFAFLTDLKSQLS